jgi:hypothetical protein
MRTLALALLTVVLAASLAAAQSDKQKKIDAAKLENCPRLKTYFEKRARSCPKAAAKAHDIECASVEDHDKLNSLLRDCSSEIEVTAPPPVEEGETPSCRAFDGAGAVLADLSEADATACRKKMKLALVEKCDGGKKIVAQLHRKARKPIAVTVRCPKK